jgi:hypothetical protein
MQHPAQDVDYLRKTVEKMPGRRYLSTGAVRVQGKGSRGWSWDRPNGKIGVFRLDLYSLREKEGKKIGKKGRFLEKYVLTAVRFILYNNKSAVKAFCFQRFF